MYCGLNLVNDVLMKTEKHAIVSFTSALSPALKALLKHEHGKHFFFYDSLVNRLI